MKVQVRLGDPQQGPKYTYWATPSMSPAVGDTVEVPCSEWYGGGTQYGTVVALDSPYDGELVSVIRVVERAQT